jgi:outer membrane protein assembly factor BamB
LPPFGSTIDWSKGIEWNVTIPVRPGKLGFYTGYPNSDGNVLFAITADIIDAADNFTLAVYSVKDGHELWHSDFSGIFVPGSTLWDFFGPIKDGVMTVFDKNTARWWAFNDNTGEKIWGPTTPYENAWDLFPNGIIAYGKLYAGTYAGRLYCHDMKTGNLQWTYTLPLSGSDTPYGDYPLSANSLSSGISVADGKLYAVTGEHTPNSPYWLGGAMYCINASTGDLVYKTPGWWSDSPAIADGYALDHNCYDGTIYCFGKGQTAVTVMAPDTAVTLDDSIVIKGTVMDQSPGTMDYAGNQLNSKGSPAIADAYMTQWMEYLYQQKTMPNNATGVPVSIDVIDANNNFRHIGTATSDITGAYSLMWKPDIPGKYTLIASFAGSESYWPSSSETSFGVEIGATPAPTAVAQTGLATTSDLMTYMAVGVIAIIIAIAIGFALVLRKRP